MDMKTREEMLQRQREIAAGNNCPHMVQCANTPERREAAIELMRSGINHDAMLGAAMLSGPCK